MDDELERFKIEANLTELAASFGYRIEGPKTGSSVTMRNGADDDKIVIRRAADGHWTYFSVRDDRDRGTAIDFLLRRRARGLGDVRKELRAWLRLDRPRVSPELYPSSLKTQSRNEASARAAYAAAMPRMSAYAPWSWMQWEWNYSGYAPTVFRLVRWIGWSCILVGWLPVAFFAVLLGKRRRESTAHGSARWAVARDLEAAGLLSGAGVVLCQTDEARYVASRGAKSTTWRMTRPGRLITHSGPEHVITFAPTRSGKGIGTVVPTLLSWNASALVYDIKKELWTLTAGWRRQFSRCWRFEPTAGDSIKFNPLLEVRRGDTEVRDVQNIADILVDPDGSNDKRDHWKLSAHALLTGTILHVLYAGQDKSLTGVARFLSNPALPIFDALQRMLATAHLASGPQVLRDDDVAAVRFRAGTDHSQRRGVACTAVETGVARPLPAGVDVVEVYRDVRPLNRDHVVERAGELQRGPLNRYLSGSGCATSRGREEAREQLQVCTSVGHLNTGRLLRRGSRPSSSSTSRTNVLHPVRPRRLGVPLDPWPGVSGTSSCGEGNPPYPIVETCGARDHVFKEGSVPG